MRHHLTTTLTLLLVAAQAKSHEFDYRIHEIINRLVDIVGWTDERRADLYALLAESVEADDPMHVIDRKVADALTKNEEHFRG